MAKGLVGTMMLTSFISPVYGANINKLKGKKVAPTQIDETLAKDLNIKNKEGLIDLKTIEDLVNKDKGAFKGVSEFNYKIEGNNGELSISYDRQNRTLKVNDTIYLIGKKDKRVSKDGFWGEVWDTIPHNKKTNRQNTLEILLGVVGNVGVKTPVTALNLITRGITFGKYGTKDISSALGWTGGTIADGAKYVFVFIPENHNYSKEWSKFDLPKYDNGKEFVEGYADVGTGAAKFGLAPARLGVKGTGYLLDKGTGKIITMPANLTYQNGKQVLNDAIQTGAALYFHNRFIKKDKNNGNTYNNVERPTILDNGKGDINNDSDERSDFRNGGSTSNDNTGSTDRPNL